MGKNNDVSVEAILDAIRTLAKPDGVRISEIRAVMANPPDPPSVRQALEALPAGIVKYNALGGTWRMANATSSSPPSAATRSSPPTATSATRSTPPAVPLPTVIDTGIPTAVDEHGVIDDSQRVVIRAEPSARQVVIAGPGFGKTAVACGRVAWLLDEGVEPAKILLLSFTRTAVREMRARIATLAGTVEGANAVNIRTLDSFSWRVRTGLSETPKTGAGYGQNIDETLAMLATPTLDVREYLDSFDHVLVDEAQDLVGSRALLVVTMLEKLRPEVGWTVFLDPAQAIYDWSEDSDQAKGPQRTFGEQLARLQPPPAHRELAHLHRTRDPSLRKLLLGARKLVLEAPDDACARLRGELASRAPDAKLFATDLAGEVFARSAQSNDLLVLTRQRGEALELSSRLTERGIRHRLRFGALPQVAAPWIAAVLNHACRNAGTTRVSRDEAETAWEAVTVANPWITEGWDIDRAWRLLRRLGPGGKNAIEITRVAARLAAASLPDDATLREVGGHGPIVSTVHGSKGREAAEVMLLLTSNHGADIDEARVLYVGLSRAKERLDVRRFAASRWSHLPDSGRPWRECDHGRMQVEVGRAGDLDPRRNVQIAAPEWVQQQDTLARFDGHCRKVRVSSFKERDWARCVVPDDSNLPLATLSTSCVDDLWDAARKIAKGAHTPSFISHLRWFDLGSVGLPPDFVPDATLPEPWHSTRLFLSPVVVGPGLVGGIK